MSALAPSCWGAELVQGAEDESRSHNDVPEGTGGMK